jgi:hypothetical protein
MMRRFSFAVSTLFYSTFFLNAQIPVNYHVLLGSQYANQSFYSMADGEKANVTNNDWDLQFATSQRSASIRVNDSKLIEVYVLANPDTSNWSSIDTTGMIQLFNADTSWEYGAFNNVGSRQHPDYGCMYYTGTGQLKGHRIFVIKLNNGQYKKFWVKSLDYYDYTILIGNLDNTDEQTIMLDKADYSSKNFVYYDLENMEVKNLEPSAEDWDLVFRKYYAMDSLSFLPFNRVTGALSNLHVQTAEIRGIPIATVTTDDGYAYTNFINNIGYDWKHYDYDNMVYEIDIDLGYFVKTPLGDVYKIVFTGFSGAINGRIDFQKTKLDQSASSVNELQNANLNSLTVYPNPAQVQVNMLISLKKESDIRITLHDISGKTVFEKNITAASGLNNFNLETTQFEKGFYFVKVTDGNAALTQKLLVAE